MIHRDPETLDQVLEQLEAMSRDVAGAPIQDLRTFADVLIAQAEFVLERWIESRGGEPTIKKSEGFRLLALHRQGAHGEPSFNACRETCREIVFRRNVAATTEDSAVALQALRQQIMVVRHLALFVAGKLEVAGLGEFCCASKSLRGNPDSRANRHTDRQGAMT